MEGNPHPAATTLKTPALPPLRIPSSISGLVSYNGRSELSAYLQYYSTSLEYNPGDVKVLGNRCAAALMLKRFVTAKEDAKAILVHDKESVRAYVRLAKACLGTGDIAGAVTWAQAAMEREPGMAQYRTEFTKMKQLQLELKTAHAKLEQADGASAAMYARRALALSPDIAVVQAQVLLAKALLLQGRAEDALKASRTALGMDSSSSAAMAAHAEALVATGLASAPLVSMQLAYNSHHALVSLH
jgi:tetratricopeptide (TPR) repeat protein